MFLITENLSQFHCVKIGMSGLNGDKSPSCTAQGERTMAEGSTRDVSVVPSEVNAFATPDGITRLILLDCDVDCA
jgi:hypothetical protein